MLGYITGRENSDPPAANPENLDQPPPLPPRLMTNYRSWSSSGPRQLGQPVRQPPVGSPQPRPRTLGDHPLDLGDELLADQPQVGPSRTPQVPSVPQPSGDAGSGSGDLINLDTDDEDYVEGSGQAGEHSPVLSGNQGDRPEFEPLAIGKVGGAALSAPPPPFTVFVQVIHNDQSIGRRYFWMDSCDSERIVNAEMTMENYFCKGIVNIHFSIFAWCDWWLCFSGCN